jgi:hypothetical protein
LLRGEVLGGRGSMREQRDPSRSAYGVSDPGFSRVKNKATNLAVNVALALYVQEYVDGFYR